MRLFNFNVCYDCIFAIDSTIVRVLTLGLKDEFCLIQQYKDFQFNQGVAANFGSVLILLLVVYTFYQLIDWSLSLTSHITTGIRETSLAAAADEVRKGGISALTTAVGGAASVAGGLAKAGAKGAAKKAIKGATGKKKAGRSGGESS